jgi:signal transduction histidine kinase/ligand-binding sensor domain-containing protein
MLWVLTLAALARVDPVWADAPAATTAVVPAAEVGLPFIHNFDPSEYGAEPQNWAIAQDRQGVIYIGNSRDGVLSFDGSTWRRIAIPNLSTVRALAADASGRIYVGAVGELGYLAPDAYGQMHYVSLLDRIPAEDRSFSDVWQVYATDEGVYFSSHTMLFRLRRDTFTAWKTATSFHMTFWARGALYVREAGRGLESMVDDQLLPVSGGERFATEKIYAIVPWGEGRADKAGDLLIGTRTQGWFVFDGTDYRPWTTQADASFKQDFLYAATWLVDGSLAVATLRGGVVLLDDHGRLLRRLSKASGLTDNTIYALFQDRQRGLWLALDTGISRIDLGSPITQFDDRAGLEGVVQQALVRHAGHLYAGTTQGVFRLDTDAEGGARFAKIDQVPDRGVAFVELDRGLLVATLRGVFEIGDQKGVVQLSEQASITLLRSKQDPARVFVGLQDGVASMRLENGHWINEGRIPGVAADPLTLWEDPDGRLWLGDKDGGAVRLTFSHDWAGASDTAHPVHVERFGIEAGLPVGPIGAYAVDGELRLAVTSGVLLEFDAGSGRFVPDPRFANLFPAGSRKVFPIEEDVRGRVWMSTVDRSTGLKETGAAVKGADGNYRWVPTPLQALSDKGILAIHGDQDGVIWFGGARGLFRYDPGVSVANDPLFAALVRSVTGSDGRPVVASSAPSAAPQLAYANNALRFAFAAPSYDTLEANRYQVLLEGVDRNWSSWSSEAYRDYNNLPEGDYRFRVRARNVYGVVSAEAVYPFGILTPWYRTWWAKFLFFAAGAAAIAALVQSRTGYLRRRQRELQRQVAARTAEVVHQKELVELRNAEVEKQKVVAEQQKAVAELAHRNISLLSDIGRLITSSLDPEAIMDTLHEHVGKLMDASVFGVGLYEQEHDLIRIPYAMECGKRFAPYTRSTSEPNQLAVWCIREKQEVFINDLAAESGRYTQDPEQTAEILVLGNLQDDSARNQPVSMIYAPLLIKDRVLGVISVHSFSSGAYEPMHLDMLRTLAAYTAIALDNADASVQLKEAQKQLLQQESMASLGRMVAGIAHELNTPLGIGITAASHLEKLLDSIEDMQGDAMLPDLREALASGRTCTGLVLSNLGKADQLVHSFKQVAVDRSSEVRRRVALRSYLDQVLASLAARLKQTRHRVEIDCPEDLEIDTVPGALYQIVANMVLNALTHAFDNDSAGRICIGARCVGKMLQLTFADDGKGMTEDVRQKVFEPFFTTRRGSGGTGLGLHLVYNLVTQLLHGTIACRSSPGQGTTFTVLLPLIA